MVLVSGAARPGHPRQGGWKIRHVLLPGLEAGKSKVKVLAKGVLGEDPPWLAKGHLLLTAPSRGGATQTQHSGAFFSSEDTDPRGDTASGCI